MKFFLEIKAWAVFIIVVLPIVFTTPAPINGILYIFGFSALFLWIFSIGYYGSKKLDEMGLPNKGNMRLFTISSFASPVFCAVFVLFRNNIGESAVGFILGLIGSVCYFYTFFLASKIMVTLEKRREASPSEYLMALLSLFMFPFGIWFIQPKVNRIFGFSDIKI